MFGLLLKQTWYSTAIAFCKDMEVFREKVLVHPNTWEPWAISSGEVSHFLVLQGALSGGQVPFSRHECSRMTGTGAELMLPLLHALIT